MTNLTHYQTKILKQAAKIYEQLAKSPESDVFDSPEKTAEFLRPRFIAEEREHFDVVFLTQQHHLIGVERLFSGTVNQSSVHIREIAKRALQLNAAAIILAHNHPSGVPSPSRSDLKITKDITETVNLFDVRVLDHIIIGSTGKWHSLAREGEMIWT